MESKNKHGLSRNIPANVEQEVRSRCGFGCVICGNAIYQYEHFNPEFAEAVSHNPKGITLLCGGCHDMKTRGLWSQDKVSGANDHPKCLEEGFSKGPFDIGTSHPEIVLGTLAFTNVQILIRLLGEPIFRITPPKNTGDIFRISAVLRDRNGNVTIHIEDNQWLTPVTNWDCKIKGQRIIIRGGIRQIELVLRSIPPRKIVVEKLHMTHLGNTIICHKGKNLTLKRSGDSFIEITGGTIKDSEVGIDITEDSWNIGLGSDSYTHFDKISFKV